MNCAARDWMRSRAWICRDCTSLPRTLSRVDQKDDLQLVTADAAAAAALQPNQNLTAKVELKDGRVLALQTTVQAPRPKVTLVSKNIERARG